MSASGVQLALLLLGGYRAMVEHVQDELARRGHPDVRPVHEFALTAVADGASSVSELGRRLGVSKQAAAKTVRFLLERGYLSQAADDDDARRKPLAVTDRGRELVATGQGLFDDRRARWADQVGAAELDELQARLRALVSDDTVRVDVAGWLGGGP